MKVISASPYTQTFWNEYILNPQSCEYNLVLDQTIEGDLDIHRLRAAVESMSQNYLLFHHVLDDKHPQLRWVKTTKNITLEIVAADCDVSKLINTPFDLREGPLCRFYLIELAPQRYNFISVVHHVLVDGLAGQEFYNAISTYYNNPSAAELPAGSIDSLNGLYRQYEEDISGLRQEFDSRAFWRNLLADCPPRVELPYLPDPSVPAGRAGEVRFALPFSEWQSLKSGIKYANPFLIFKTLWALLIARLSPQDRVYIGYPIAAEGGSALYYGAQVNTAVFSADAVAGGHLQPAIPGDPGLQQSAKSHGQTAAQQIADLRHFGPKPDPPVERQLYSGLSQGCAVESRRVQG
ncbi:condensation domain-containing protein [Serratia plymuthica]|uniref:condensation domain-containing protein n=1 Tax=Serratia plymuthica TaxID=82996 RepID=UPI000F16926C|nr:condensation domain-containing protein [Serratia plymuthica]RKS61091.1 condensation domain-containing protein [Serratia plymuthica]